MYIALRSKNGDWLAFRVPNPVLCPESYYTCVEISLADFPALRLTELALDECEGLLAVLVHVLLVGVGIVSIAAVRVCRIAVRLDDGRVGGRALEAAGAGSELQDAVSRDIHNLELVGFLTYTTSLAGSNITVARRVSKRFH
jgi:hypothetical protein